MSKIVIIVLMYYSQKPKDLNYPKCETRPSSGSYFLAPIAVRVRSLFGCSGIYGGQSGNGAGFLPSFSVSLAKHPID
jgi:hypothetical protein